MSRVAHQAGAYPGYRSMKRLGIFLLPPGWMLVHRRVTPIIKFASTHLYTWVERGTVRVKCLAHEHNAMCPARSRTQTARSGVECTIHEATAPWWPIGICVFKNGFYFFLKSSSVTIRCLVVHVGSLSPYGIYRNKSKNTVSALFDLSNLFSL